jgi:RNA polymerase sigma-70 factor (ECF subfamily)
MRKMLETHKTEAFDPPAAAPSEWSEKEAIAACKEGDHSAFQELVRKYESRIFNHCLRMVDDEQESADLTQEVLVKVYRNIRNYEQTYSFYTWVYRITVNCCIDFLRKKKRKYAGVSLSLGKAENPAELGNEREIPDQTFCPEQLLSNAELRAVLNGAIAQLSEKLRTIIVLKEIEGLTYEEIGEILHCSRGTVKSRLFRARGRLRELLAPHMEQGTLW